MNRKGTKRGPGNQVLTRYGKKLLNTHELRELSGNPDLTRKNVYDRLRRLGFPPELNDENYNDILGPLCDPVMIIRCFTVVGDNKKYAGSELSRKFKVPRSTMSRLKKKGKLVLTVDELKEMASIASVPKQTDKKESDLEHLSGSRNTGIAKREATEKVTIDSVNRLASAVIKRALVEYLRPDLKGKGSMDKAAVTTAARQKEASASFLFTENAMRKFWFENLGMTEEIMDKRHVDKHGPDILRRLACESYEGLQHNS